MTSEFDVIISGAGPAGCTAALALGSSGLRIALIEKERFPREKVCGDATPPYVPKVLNTINPEYGKAFEELSEKEKINVCRITVPDKKSLNLKFSEYGFTCKRMIFDAFLFKLASQLSNLTVFQDTQVRDARWDDTGVIIYTDKNLDLKSQLVIGCDGANSIIRKKLAGPKTAAGEYSVAVRTYFRNIKESTPGVLEFHFINDLMPGYFWIFPLPDNQFNVGLGLPSKIISEKSINLSNELLRITDTVPSLGNRFSKAEMTGEIKGHLLPLCSRKIPISGNRFMLCGDAASLINPVTGSGIGQAMQSGRYAGWHALKCFEKNDFSDDFMRLYDKTIHEKLWPGNRHYLMIRQFIIKYPAILNTIAKAGSASKFINRMMIKNLE